MASNEVKKDTECSHSCLTEDGFCEDHPRRGFFARWAILVGGTITAFPFVAGLGMIFNPLLQKKKSGDQESGETLFMKVALLDMLPPDGIPRQFAVKTDRVDAWTKTLNEKVGSVFLKHEIVDKQPRVSAITSECPHLGCSVSYSKAGAEYSCPCHVSAFKTADGSRIKGPSLRGLDSLEVKLEENNGATEVWVAFKRFKSGIAEKVETS